MASPSHDSDAKANQNVKRRGPTFKKNIIRAKSKGEPTRVVTWNSRGQPIGSNGRELKSYIGSIVRQTVPITYSNWKDQKDPVLEGYKNEIWCEIQKTFDVDEIRKDIILKQAGKSHRTFRAFLAKKWLTDKKGNVRLDPPPPYAEFIGVDDWRAFVAKYTKDDEFLRISHANRQRASNPPYPYRGGVKGYPGIEEELLMEAGADTTTKSIDRHILWIEARQNKEGVIEHPTTREVAERIETLSQFVSQEEITDCFGRQDILARALPAKEYPGRLRGVGFGVSQKAVFGSQKRTKQDETEELRRMVVQLYKEVQELKSSMKDKEPVHEPDLPTSTPSSARDSCTPEGMEECMLYLSNPSRLVGKGIVYSDLSATLHNRPLPLHHVKVRVDFASKGDAPLPVPLEEANVMTVEQAIGTYVAWPIKLVVVPIKSKVKDKDKGKVQEHTAGMGKPQTVESVTSLVKNVGKSQPSPPTARAGEFFIYLKVHALTIMKGGGHIDVVMDPDILGYPHTLMLGANNELREVFTHDEWISQTVISVYIRYLYTKILIPEERTQRFVFLCPERTSLHFESAQMKQYIAERLALAKLEYETLFLSPCNVGGHWVLLAINPNEDTVYYLDPLRTELRLRKKMKDAYNQALLIHRGLDDRPKSRFSKSSKTTKWITIKCPCQPNNNDCGYYVLKFMKDIVVQNQIEIPEEYFPECKCDSYFDDLITELKEEWCRYVAEKFI